MNPKTIPQTPHDTAIETLKWLDISHFRPCKNGDFRHMVMYNLKKHFPNDPLTEIAIKYDKKYSDVEFREAIKRLIKGGESDI